MKTNEIFEHVLQIVCEECELCYGELINGAKKMRSTHVACSSVRWYRSASPRRTPPLIFP